MSDRVNGMISIAKFLDDHAFSFHNQPYLKDLFGAVRDSRERLTIVVGAGVSIGAGLPSWPALIDNMLGEIGAAKYKEMLKKDQIDPMRKAEIVLHLARKVHGPSQAAERDLVRKALYQGTSEMPPGQLAQSVARLAVTRKNVRLMTTNFDYLLEEALQKHLPHELVQSFGLLQVKQWRKWTEGVGVLHLHGVVRPRREDEPEETEELAEMQPIVLAESQFLKHGSRVRKIIARELRDSHALFVGLSISDPNLVGPLYATCQKDKQSRPGLSRFMLTVPRVEKETPDAENVTSYAFDSAGYFDSGLALKPVFLKSYSQLNQVVADLTLSVLDPPGYFDRPKDDTLEYGRRLNRALDECYRNIGCLAGDTSPQNAAAELLTKKLHEELEAGPLDFLHRCEPNYPAALRATGEQERFALFLWLRSRSPGNGEAAPYMLNLVGNSIYTYREGWFLRHHVAEIRRDSSRAVARAVFLGNTQAVSQPGPPWRGVLATPIVVARTGGARISDGTPADILTVGVIALHSTKKMAGPGNDSGASTGGEAEREPISLVKRLGPEDTFELQAQLYKAAQKILLPE